MGFHSVMSANWHKNMGYGSDMSDFWNIGMGYCSEWRRTVSACEVEL